MSSVLRCSHNSHFSIPHCVGRTKYENTDSSMIGRFWLCDVKYLVGGSCCAEDEVLGEHSPLNN